MKVNSRELRTCVHTKKNKPNRKGMFMSDKVIDIPEKPEEKDYVIAYIDLLGTKELLLNNDSDKVFDTIYYAFVMACKFMPEIEPFQLEELKIKIFSDNILLAYPIGEDYSKESIYFAYKKICRFLYLFLPMFINKGILFRGAITIGELSINEIMVWGKGLSEVVYLEENTAIYPRIILSESLLNVFSEYNLHDVQYEEKFCCLVDFDNCVFFDFFDYNDILNTRKTLRLAKSHINEKISNENKPKVLQKYCWFKNYIQRATDIFKEVTSEISWFE